MNRREAIAALVSMPEITRIAAAPVKPNDVIVVEMDGYLSQDQAKRIKEHIAPIWPNNKILVLDKGMTLKVVTGG